MQIKTDIHNKEAHQKYLQMYRNIHDFMEKKGYTQVDVPVLSPSLIPESYLEVFETEFYFSKKRERLYLTPSPELFLKRLIAKGIGNCYAMTKSFRNSEPSSSRHSSEFTLLEFYKVEADYMDIAKDTLEMMQSIAQTLYGKNEITYHNKRVSFAKWEKITVSEAFDQYAGISNVLDEERFLHDAKKKDYEVEGFSYTDLWSQIYTQEVEPHLGVNGFPTIIYEYPPQLAATAQLNTTKGVAERLEFYIEGIELGNCGNASTKTTNKKDEEKRMDTETDLRKKMGKISYKSDKEFVDVLLHMPACAGIAIGLERLGMVFTNVSKIGDLKLVCIE